MKTYVELSLVAVLIVLLYQPPLPVIDFAKSGIGKAILIISIVAISHQFGMNAGLLAAIIGVVLLNNQGTVKEGAFAPGAGAPNNDHGGDLACVQPCKDYKNDTANFNACMERCKAGVVDPFTNHCEEGDNDCLSGQSNEQRPPLTESHRNRAIEAAKKAGVNISEMFSNYTLDEAADYPNLKSTLTMLDTNENIKRSMRASEYAKTAPAGSALMTNHLDTVSVVNKNSPIMDGM